MTTQAFFASLARPPFSAPTVLSPGATTTRQSYSHGGAAAAEDVDRVEAHAYRREHVSANPLCDAFAATHATQNQGESSDDSVGTVAAAAIGLLAGVGFQSPDYQTITAFAQLVAGRLGTGVEWVFAQARYETRHKPQSGSLTPTEALFAAIASESDVSSAPREATSRADRTKTVEVSTRLDTYMSADQFLTYFRKSTSLSEAVKAIRKDFPTYREVSIYARARRLGCKFDGVGNFYQESPKFADGSRRSIKTLSATKNAANSVKSSDGNTTNSDGYSSSSDGYTSSSDSEYLPSQARRYSSAGNRRPLKRARTSQAE